MAEKMLNINLEHGQRKRFTIDGDKNRILEINPSDLGIFERVEKFDKEVEEALAVFSEKQAAVDDENFDMAELGKQLSELDNLIRAKLDYLFDTSFSEVTTPHGTMLDPVNGEFRFMYLLDVFGEVYNDQITKELKVRNDTIRKHTKKYVNKVNKE